MPFLLIVPFFWEIFAVKPKKINKLYFKEKEKEKDREREREDRRKDGVPTHGETQSRAAGEQRRERKSESSNPRSDRG